MMMQELFKAEGRNQRRNKLFSKSHLVKVLSVYFVDSNIPEEPQDTYENFNLETPY